MYIIKRNGTKQEFDPEKINRAISAALQVCNCGIQNPAQFIEVNDGDSVELIQDRIENWLMDICKDAAKAFILYRERHKTLRDWVSQKESFIENYKKSSNTANATIDDNSNVSGKNIGILNAEIHKPDNILINRGMIEKELRELYPEFDAKQYSKDLNHHIIYKHDESSFAGAIAPYCCSITMYPFLNDGIKNIGGLSAYPKNIDSFCGMYINLIFATSAQFAGAVATSEFLLYFDYFAKKEWGDTYYINPDQLITSNLVQRNKTIRRQIHQYFQQVVYSINQPAAARGMQAAFVNFSYFDKPFFDGMFGNFVFPDNTKPTWESLNWLQKEFMQWFNNERLKTMITFPVESFALIYKNGDFVDKENAKFVAEEYARGHSFFTYISDSVDSLSSCCRLRNTIQTKEFNFTNGNMGIQTGSKSVITLNLNRIIQDWYKQYNTVSGLDATTSTKDSQKQYLINILDRVYKYHTAYNSLLHKMYNAKLLPVYSAGFINLNKQYLTIGINGLNEAANFLGIECTDNDEYKDFCRFIFSTIKEQNILHRTKTETYNTECVPAESLAIKNYNWDKNDGYWVPDNINLYASYIYRPNDKTLSVLDKFRMHGSEYIGDYLDGGSAAHVNLEEHLSTKQYEKLLKYAAEVGCQYFTFNVPNSECENCGYITKHPIHTCPKCGSTKISLWDRIIGYLTKISNWSTGRQIEQKTRVYSKNIDNV